ncbi:MULTISPECIES: aspartate/glutamate racemase family protein [Ramlibacter]|uniref:Amino acid racemase n=1 Tax=Ramlibacter pinisoli TaxID=2682844 RepID=A0A6N8IYX6_9BURK|nr:MULTISPECIES: amino acid racemase [Ramlibacter]MBA2962297.1 amino acid racemase [Ramlibacter sp. CGMCC 1.13660]MVQ32239.1 amino acid racemase [Ramlibacter pinisoli]
MKKIGLIGGISWHSTVEYYRGINLETGRRLGGLHSAPLVLESLDFEVIARLGAQGHEEEVFARFLAAARSLRQSGAQVLALCANTAHRRADRLEQSLGHPLVQIGDALGQAVRAAGMARVGLLGTARTMTEPFLQQRLVDRHGLQVLTPDAPACDAIDGFIFGEMARGVFSQPARAAVLRACDDLAARGAQGVILGCTELPILLRDIATPCPTFDSTQLHAVSIVDAALAREMA